ncbi:MAG TPA: CBS domain-containing protein [Coleofasciculaceae cyanobacterium]|jgi:tRNA nucleotidyltransferase (CCA-adding enzyme)
MDLILCHSTADFDTLGGAVGLSRLLPGARIVLVAGSHPTVQEFLALHRDEYALIERRSVNPAQIRSLTIVDTQSRDRLGKAAEWLDLPNIKVTVYDHHAHALSDIAADYKLEPIGAVTTLVVELLRAQQISLTLAEATVMALGIHVDTGSLTFDGTTVRDAAALTWLMEQGADIETIATYRQSALSPPLQDLLTVALDQLETETIRGCPIAWVELDLEAHLPGMSQLAAQLLSLVEAEVLLLLMRHPIAAGKEERLTVIGRSRGTVPVNLAQLFQPFGGGGHPRAATLTQRGANADILAKLLENLRSQIPQPPTARSLMSSPVRTIRPETTIAEAQRILLRYGHSGLSVVDAQDQLVGIISRRDLDIALRHGFAHAPVKGYMATDLKTITPDTLLPDIEALMVTYGIGRLPVLEQGELVGIVTRTDVLRQMHRDRRREQGQAYQTAHPSGWSTDSDTLNPSCLLPEVINALLRDRLTPDLWQLLRAIAQQAEQRGWHLYLVGGAVRDLLLADSAQTSQIQDIDLVVDGFEQAADRAGVELAQALQQTYPQTKLQVHGQFQTAALLWHNDPVLGSLWMDIATARTEFYPYPAANPEVEASSIRQDLYRRDFTINALAVRLTAPGAGELLDFFGGVLDLKTQQIRVLHANSFIEDPTRIYRAVRFAVRLNFQIEPQTESYIRFAIASGIYSRIPSGKQMEKAPALQTRLKQELKYIFQSSDWQAALRLLADLGALVCIYPDLTLTDARLWQMRRVDRWLKRFDPQQRLTHWQILLEVLLVSLPPNDRLTVAQTLQLPAESCERLRHLHTLQAQILPALSQSDRPSQIVKILGSVDRTTLILLGATASRETRRQIWRYLTHWQATKTPLDGHDLQIMGYLPGKQYKEILERLLAATLDGEVSDRSSAEALVKTQFPQG